MFTLDQLGQSQYTLPDWARTTGLPVDLRTSPYWGAKDTARGGSTTMGNGDGSGYYAPLDQFAGSQGMGDNMEGATQARPGEAMDWLNGTGQQIYEAGQGEQIARWLQDANGNITTEPMIASTKDNTFTLAALAAMGIAGGAAAGAFGGTTGGTAATSSGSLFGNSAVGGGLKIGGAAGLGGTGAGLSTALPAATSLGTTGLGAAQGSFLGGLGGAALKSAGVNGGLTALNGGSGSDILKSAAIGGATGGAGYYASNGLGLSGLAAKAAGSATSGIVGSALNGGTGSEIARAGLIGGASQGLPNVASYVGVPEGYQNTANSALSGGITSSLAGGSFSQGATRGALPAAMSDLYNGINTPTQTDTGNTNMNETNPFFSNLRNSLGLNNVSGKDVGDFAQGLAGLYTGYQQRRQAKDMMSMMGLRRGAYETQLRNNLERRDAAAGRRSDYGGRETQLQASLAELDSRNAPGMNQLMNTKLGGNVSMLQSLLRMGEKQKWFGSQTSSQTPVNYSLPTNADFSMPSAPSADPYDLSSLFQQRRGRFGGAG